jgi:hypothetical protein
LEEQGMVMAVLDKAFDVLIIKLGVIKRVYCEVSSLLIMYTVIFTRMAFFLLNDLILGHMTTG